MEPIYMSRAEYAQQKSQEPIRMSRAEYAEAKSTEGSGDMPMELTNRDPQASGKPEDEHRIVNALGEIIPRPQQQLQDIGRGAMKGFADVGESITSGFGNYRNPVSEKFLTASQFWADEQVRPESGSIGEVLSDELVGGIAGGLVGKSVDSLWKGLKTLTGASGNRELRKIKEYVDRAIVNDDSKITSYLPDKELVYKGTEPYYGANVLLGSTPNKGSNAKRITDSIDDIVEDSSKPIVTSMVERLFGRKVPVLSTGTDALLSPVSGKAALRLRGDYVKGLMDKGYTNAQAMRMYDTIIKQQHNVGSKLGTATGALLGTTVDD